MRLDMLLLVCLLLGPAFCSIYQARYAEALKIATAMTLQQKIGQILQVDFNAITSKKGTDPAQALKYFLGSLLVGGDGTPDANGDMSVIPDNAQDKTILIYNQSTMEKWQKLSSKFNISMRFKTAEGKQYDVRPLLGTDAVHGNQHVVGTVLFPHNIGLSCTHNADNFYNAGYWTAQSVRESGFNYVFGPTVAVSHNPQWGRFYQTMGSEPSYIYQYASAYTRGLQSTKDVVGSAKHFFADGATLYGADEGNAVISSYKSFIPHNVQGYNGSISAEVGSVMCSYSAINWMPLALGPYLSTILRKDLKFDGFVISDYDEVGKMMGQGLPTSLQTINRTSYALSQMLNAGIDMIMLPGWAGLQPVFETINGFKEAIVNKTLSMERLNDAVARVLSVKLVLNLATAVDGEQAQEQFKQQNHVHKLKREGRVKQHWKSTTAYQDSLTAVRESAVLLKNSGVLPLQMGSLQYIVLVGERIININNLAKNELFRSFDNIGMQCGGWSLRWQGFEGQSMWSGDNKKSANASSILDALNSLANHPTLVYPNYTSLTESIKIDEERTKFLSELKTLRKKMTAKNTIILGVLGESPYAQFKGDVGVPYCVNQTILGGDGCLYDNIGHPYLPPKQRVSLTLDYEKFDKEVVAAIKQEDKNIALVSVFLAGRPFVMDNVFADSSAVLASFLPGTSGGQGIVDVLTGKYVLRGQGAEDRRNTLSFDWPRTVASLKNYPIYSADGTVPALDNPLFKVGHGLSTLTN